MNPPDFQRPGQLTADQPPKNDDQHGVHNPLSVMQPGEQIICEIKRHPIGIFGIYAAAGLILIVLAVLAFIVGPNIFGEDNRGTVTAIGGVVFVVLAVLSLVFVFISNIVYWGNIWVVTSDSLTQITQTSLFSKQSSQLSLGNLEDVTTEKNGILAQLLNFGVLKAETAGERSKFVFLYCPNPNYYAQKVLAAREQFELAHHGGKQEPFVIPPVPQPNGTSQAPPNDMPPTLPDQPPAGPSAYQTAYTPPPHEPPLSAAPYAEPEPPLPTFPSVDQAAAVANPPDNSPPAPPYV